MGSSPWVLLATSLLVAGAAATAVMDKALTSAARTGLREDKIYLTFRDIAAPHRHHLVAEPKQTLLSLAFPGHSRFGVALERNQGQVLLESIIGGETVVREISAPSIKPRGRVTSLVVEVDQAASVASVYFQCKLLATVALPVPLRDMTTDLQSLRVYRERHQDVSLDWDTSVLGLLEKLGCPTGEDTGSVQAQGNEVYTYRRGDIPILHEDETSTMLVKTLNELIETIKELQIEIQTQREETALLRDALLNCAACKPGRGHLLGR